MSESNNAGDEYKKIPAKSINAFTQESGEEPTMMINVVCHSSIIKLKAPYLYNLVQENKRRGTLGMTSKVAYPKQGDQTSAHQSERPSLFRPYLLRPSPES